MTTMTIKSKSILKVLHTQSDERRRRRRRKTHTHRPIGRKRDNICLQMTCHTFIWLHDWNNERKLLYRKQISSRMRSCWVSGFSQISQHEQCQAKSTTRHSHHFTIIFRTTDRMNERWWWRRSDEKEMKHFLLSNWNRLAMLFAKIHRKSWKYATLAHNEIQSWSTPNT